jgi:phosphate transport system protein
MHKHISTQFDSELAAVSGRALEMGGLVEIQIRLAIEALTLMNTDVAKAVLEAERDVNQYEIDIERELSNIIGRRQPTARDLRLLMAISRMVSNLERVGDETKKIARLIQSIAHSQSKQAYQLPLGDQRLASDLAARASMQLRKALDAFVRLDASECVTILRLDDAIDQAFGDYVRRLVIYMMEDPRAISASLDLVFIAKAIERIGDHAKNIAECVIYVVSGADVRHVEIDSLESAVK